MSLSTVDAPAAGALSVAQRSIPGNPYYHGILISFAQAARILFLPHCPPGLTQGDRECLGQGHGRAADQAAQIAGIGVHLAAAHAEVGVSEDLRQHGG